MPKKPGSTTTRRNGVDAKSTRTRARILDAAAHVLSVKGFAGTRLTDVADYADLQAPAIYYYFPSREDLIEEVMYCGISDMRRHLQDTLDWLSKHPTACQHIEMETYTWAVLPENLRTGDVVDQLTAEYSWTGRQTRSEGSEGSHRSKGASWSARRPWYHWSGAEPDRGEGHRTHARAGWRVRRRAGVLPCRVCAHQRRME